MPKKAQPYKTIIPAGGVNRDINPEVIPEQQAADVQNIRFLKDGFAQRGGYNTLPSINLENNLPLDSQVVGLVNVNKLGGADLPVQIAFTLDHAYYKDNSTPFNWQIMTQGTLIEDCEDVWTDNADVTTTLRTGTLEYKRGAKAIKISIESNFGVGIAAYENFSAKDLTGDTYLHLWYSYTQGPIAADVLSIRLSEQNAGGGGATYADYNIPAVGIPWQRLLLPLNAPDASNGGTYPDDLNAVLSVSLVVNSDPGTVAINLDDIRTVKVFTGDEDNLVSSAFFPNQSAEKVYITNNKDFPQQWDLDVSSETMFEDITNLSGVFSSAGDTARAVGVYKNYLLLMNTIEGGTDMGQRVRWCDTADATNWTTGKARHRDSIEDNGKLMGGKPIGGSFALYYERAIENMTFIGGYAIFDFKVRVPGLGSPVGLSIQEIPGNQHIFLGTDLGLYTYNGSVVVPLSEGIVKDYINDTLNTKYFDRTFAFVWTENNEYHLWYCNSSSTPDTCIVYNYVNKTHTIYSLPTTAGSVYYEASTVTIDNLSGTINALDGTINDLGSSAFSASAIIGDNSGYVYQIKNATLNDNGSAITAYLETKDFMFGSPERTDRVLKLGYSAKGNSLIVSHSTDEGATWLKNQTQSLTAIYTQYDYFLNKTPKKIRFRFYNNTVSETFAVRWYQPWVIPRVV